MQIQHVDRLIPYVIGIVPICIAILVNGFNIFITGLFAMIISTCALYQLSDSLQHQNLYIMCKRHK